MSQLSLFEITALEGIGTHGSTAGLYDHFSRSLGLSKKDMAEKISAGKGGMVSKWRRKLRYLQQTLKHMGLIEKGSDRGKWEVTPEGKRHLTFQSPERFEVAFVTNSGIAFFGDGRNLAKIFPGEVELILTSPPYFLTKDRAYGGYGKSEKEYVATLVSMVESWLPMLTKTGSVALNLGFSGSDPHTGQSSIAPERVLIALEDQLGLHLVQRIVWENPAKPPSGYWTTKARQRLTETNEIVYWLSLNPKASKADNRRVLQPYSGKQVELMRQHAQKISRSGRLTKPSGHSACLDSYYADNGGAIPKTLASHPHESAHSNYSKVCKEMGLPRHPAMMPFGLAQMLVKLITQEQDLMADPCAGSLQTALAAEMNNRRWCASELVKEYLQGAYHGRFASLN